MIAENLDDIIKGDYHCPRCGQLLREKKPKDRFIIRNKDTTIRLSCVCGYYEDRIIKPEDFQDSA